MRTRFSKRTVTVAKTGILAPARSHLADSGQAKNRLCAAAPSFEDGGQKPRSPSRILANRVATCLDTSLLAAACKELADDRLKKIGLGDFCLEMHSNKANKTAVISRPGVALERAAALNQVEWERLDRDALNAYAAELHRSCPNGLTPYAAMGIIVRDGDLPEIELRWPSADSHDSVAFDELFQKAENLKIHGEKCLGLNNTALRHMGNAQWSSLWPKRFETTAQAAASALQKLLALWRELAAGQPEPDVAMLANLAELPPSLPQWLYGDNLAQIGVGLQS